MKNTFITGIAVGALAVAAISEMDDEMSSIWKKSKKYLKKKIVDMF